MGDEIKVVTKEADLYVAVSDELAAEIAHEVLANKTRSHVQAAGTLATVVLASQARFRVVAVIEDNLRTTQERCTTLIQEARQLARELVGAHVWKDRFVHEAEDLARSRSELTKARRIGDRYDAENRLLRQHVAEIDMYLKATDAQVPHVRAAVDAAMRCAIPPVEVYVADAPAELPVIPPEDNTLEITKVEPIAF